MQKKVFVDVLTHAHYLELKYKFENHLQHKGRLSIRWRKFMASFCYCLLLHFRQLVVRRSFNPFPVVGISCFIWLNFLKYFFLCIDRCTLFGTVWNSTHYKFENHLQKKGRLSTRRRKLTASSSCLLLHSRQLVAWCSSNQFPVVGTSCFIWLNCFLQRP